MDVSKNYKVILVSAVLLFIISFSFPVHSATWKIVYPKEAFDGDTRNQYPIELLELALAKTNVRYELHASESSIRQYRAIRKLRENIEINVIWSMTDIQREEELLPIRVPIAKGLIGWRLLLAKRDNPVFDEKISTLSQLLNYSVVQGVDWPDTKILQASGFNLVPAQTMLEGHEILINGQSDFFPRSIIEVMDELTLERRALGVAIKDDVILNYPVAMYFFVNKRNKTLARLIETGLIRSINDGSFDTLFLKHHGAAVDILTSHEGQIFTLDNPLLPPASATLDERLWYSLDKKE